MSLTANQLFTLRHELGLTRNIYFNAQFSLWRWPPVGSILKIGIVYQAVDSPSDWWHDGAWAYCYMFGNLSTGHAHHLEGRCWEEGRKDVCLELLARDDKQLIGFAPSVAEHVDPLSEVGQAIEKLGDQKVWTPEDGDVGGYCGHNIANAIESLHERTQQYTPSAEMVHPSWQTVIEITPSKEPVKTK